ncbi:fibroblast growth factor receptor substrate 3-like isoform X2 [Portunus trituberculatus]|uniref:fibroblast growth factor receptor substrate 3-like isoform X2 n=1 Tax=Portunus trituberculatus TaxID=210409 RepID=UPI001E1CC541|nr:fibroblast growth factor receptor substrate 3-like isoform X2 [Portunus trituberculatus]
MSSGSDALYRGGSLPSKKVPNTSYRRGYGSSDKRFPMPIMEESQFLIRLKKETEQKLQVSEDDDEEEEDNEKEAAAEELVTFLVQTDRVVVVRKERSWGWKLGCIRRYGYTENDFYFESGRKARTGEGLFTFLTDSGERIHSRLTMMKEFCQFDLYCQRGVIPDLLLVNNPPNRAASLRDKSERNLDKKETNGRRTSTGSLPY